MIAAVAGCTMGIHGKVTQRFLGQFALLSSVRNLTAAHGRLRCTETVALFTQVIRYPTISDILSVCEIM